MKIYMVSLLHRATINQPANITNSYGTRILVTAMSFAQCMPHGACAWYLKSTLLS